MLLAECVCTPRRTRSWRERCTERYRNAEKWPWRLGLSKLESSAGVRHKSRARKNRACQPTMPEKTAGSKKNRNLIVRTCFERTRQRRFGTVCTIHTHGLSFAVSFRQRGTRIQEEANLVTCAYCIIPNFLYATGWLAAQVHV